MASLLQKLLANQSAKSMITTFHKPQSPTLIPTLLNRLHQNSHKFNLSPFLGPPRTGDSISPHSPPIFPSYPFGLSLNPINLTGLVPSGPSEAVAGDTQAMWADSVKKKRKRKMNKHKYQKLRKRLRHN
ncbi:hypothetical protein Vadar_034073 [Vaccinium darrowii]|uniref:Uncharacterized protein n=1 Tax=Vaccinium darrowii TaxID=229202 RepID=A0ACB7Y3Z6_9ERIC|nr:hypothetical protein Vadar_034073 [Vaccinium darrowii]